MPGAVSTAHATCDGFCFVKATACGPQLPGKKACIKPVPIPGYFSDEFTEVKLVLREVPMLLTAARITMLRPTAIRQYSMAVAADSLRKKFKSNFFIQKLLPTPAAILRAMPAQNLDFAGYRLVEEQPQ